MKKVFLASLLLMLVACVTAKEKQLEQNVAEQNEIQNPNQAAHSGRFAIRFSDKLNKDQKAKFLDLMNKTEASVNVIRAREGQLKAALFQSLAEGKYDPKEIRLIKNRLKMLEDEKLDLMFSSLENVRVILGGLPSEDPELLDLYRAQLSH